MTTRRKKLVQPATRAKNGPITTRRILGVNDLTPLAKQHALRLAGNDTDRIEVISPNEARIHNPGR